MSGCPVPKEGKDFNFVGRKCPSIGNVISRGKMLKGMVVSTKVRRIIMPDHRPEWRDGGRHAPSFPERPHGSLPCSGHLCDRSQGAECDRSQRRVGFARKAPSMRKTVCVCFVHTWRRVVRTPEASTCGPPGTINGGRMGAKANCTEDLVCSHCWLYIEPFVATLEAAPPPW